MKTFLMRMLLLPRAIGHGSIGLLMFGVPSEEKAYVFN